MGGQGQWVSDTMDISASTSQTFTSLCFPRQLCFNLQTGSHCVKLVLNSWSSCPSLLSAGVRSISLCTGKLFVLFSSSLFFWFFFLVVIKALKHFFQSTFIYFENVCVEMKRQLRVGSLLLPCGSQSLEPKLLAASALTHLRFILVS